MATICLRRTKEMKFVNLGLPELKEYVHRVKFSKEERDKYDVLKLVTPYHLYLKSLLNYDTGPKQKVFWNDMSKAKLLERINKRPSVLTLYNHKHQGQPSPLTMITVAFLSIYFA